MKKAVFTLFILIIVGGFAYANGEKEEISTAADSVVAFGIAIEDAPDNSMLPMDKPTMVVSTRYNFINILDNKKRLIA